MLHTTPLLRITSALPTLGSARVSPHTASSHTLTVQGRLLEHTPEQTTIMTLTVMRLYRVRITSQVSCRHFYPIIPYTLQWSLQPNPFDLAKYYPPFLEKEGGVLLKMGFQIYSRLSPNHCTLRSLNTKQRVKSK